MTDSSTLFYALVALVAAGGGGTGLVTLLKWRSERPGIVRDAAIAASERAVGVVNAAIGRLENELQECVRDRSDLRALIRQHEVELRRMRAQLADHGIPPDQ